MSEHLEMSGESSLDKNFQIRTNNEGENELYIPCWEEEGSNSTQYHHLIEETKFYKNKCNHLENHLEENHREFSSLNQLYMIAESNERRLLKEN
jgi:ribosomal protein S15P/S13E